MSCVYFFPRFPTDLLFRAECNNLGRYEMALPRATMGRLKGFFDTTALHWHEHSYFELLATCKRTILSFTDTFTIWDDRKGLEMRRHDLEIHRPRRHFG